MRRLPSKTEILERARQISLERGIIAGLPAITPTDAELKESGVFHEARLELMRDPGTGALAQQHKYLSEMASELDLKVLEKKSWRLFQRKFGAYRWHIRGLRHLLQPQVAIPKSPVPIVTVRTKPARTILPKPKKHRKFDPWAVAIRGPEYAKKMLQKEAPKAKPKPKRKKRHVSRTGKTMRKLRKVKGVKVFSFPDHIWKVRKP